MNTINHFTGIDGARKYAFDYDAVISLGSDIVEDIFLKPDTKRLILEFDDVDLEAIEKDQVVPLELLCTEDHIKQLVRFVRALKPEDKLLTHCYAGKNRSSAGTIIAICEREGIGYWKAIQDLSKCRIPWPADIEPNSLMLHHYLMNKPISLT